VGFAGIALGATFMTMSAMLMWFFPTHLIRILTNDVQVIHAATGLLAIAGAFQIADGVQGVAVGALRGAGRTTESFWAHLLGHWLVGAPLGITLSFGLNWGVKGLWWGLTAGLFVVSGILVYRFAITDIRKLSVDCL
jgi:MATE family multidrug resistance protein